MLKLMRNAARVMEYSLPILVIRLFVGDLWAIESGRQCVGHDVTAID